MALVRSRSRSLGSCLCLCLAALVGACSGPTGDPVDPTNGTSGTTESTVDPTTGSSEGTDGSESSTGAAVTEGTETSTGATDTGVDESTGPGEPVCGNGMLEDGEGCDDGNGDDTDACLTTCVAATCGDGFVQTGLEGCDDGNGDDTDACLATCVAATCGDGLVQTGVEGCDDGNGDDTDACLTTCASATCGDGLVQTGVEGCDDGNAVGGDGCDAACLTECGNLGGGALTAENGTGTGVTYCYGAADSTQVRAQKACESHFGVGGCCIIIGGYQNQQYGQCGLGGDPGSLHWHWDSHPAGHCAPFYVVGDVVSPGWCGIVTGNFLD